MDPIVYPDDKKVLEQWVNILRRINKRLKMKLPNTDDKWYEQVLNCIELTKIAYCGEDVHKKAAHLFYYIVKGHKITDGNKRTTIVVVFLFYLMNDYLLENQVGIKKLAKRIAGTHGSKFKDKYITEIEVALRKHTTELDFK